MQKINILKKIKLTSEIKMVLWECICFALGFFLTPLRFALGIYPFGVALLCATTKYTIFAYAGAILSVFFFMDSDLVYIIALSVLLVLRLIASLMKKPENESAPLLGERVHRNIFSGLFEENLSARIFISLSVATGIGIYYVIVNGYMFYDIFSLVFFASVSLLFLMAFRVLSRANEAKAI